MDIDFVLLSRIGFALTASYHIIFPCLIVGLIFYLTTMEALWLKTGNETYRIQYLFWLKPFTVAFLVAVITGVGLSFQLDTHFGNFYRTTVDILVPLRHIELLNAVFLEAGALGIMLLGMKRVGPKLHFTATLMMNLGILISFICIIARNSWMQTPDGYGMINGELVLTDWFSAIINPSFPYRFMHMLVAALVSTACFILGISAWFLLKQRHVSFARFNLRNAVFTIALLAPLQFIIGDLHGLNTKEYQPLKIAAIEGLWETTKGAPLVLFGIPNSEKEVNHASVEIPKLGSLILTHASDGEIIGLKDYAKKDRPNITVIFYSFRIMVGVGLWLTLLGLVGAFLAYKKKLLNNVLFLRFSVLSLPFGFIATISGWIVAEAGRQPWVVYEIIRTVDVLLNITHQQAIHSLTLLGIVYGMTCLGFIYALWRILKQGPDTNPYPLIS
jgi:cytochrome d ubiquinol oxidase subunit I